MADLALEAGGEFAHRRVAFLFGLSFGLGALGVGAGFGGVRGFGLGGLLCGRLEQMRELVGKPDQYAGLDDENDGMKNDAPKIGAAGINRCRKDEVQHQMMQRDRDRAGEDRPIVAIGDQTRQRREEVHVHVDLPGMPRQLEGKHRYAAHQGDGKDQTGRKPVA